MVRYNLFIVGMCPCLVLGPRQPFRERQSCFFQYSTAFLWISHLQKGPEESLSFVSTGAGSNSEEIFYQGEVVLAGSSSYPEGTGDIYPRLLGGEE